MFYSIALCIMMTAYTMAIGNDCPRPCTKSLKPACGTDGVTYKTHCALVAEACRTNLDLKLDHYGKCEKKGDNDCPIACFTNYVPVCGSDGKVYGNLCSLKSTACLTKTDITVVKQGQCDDEIVG